MVELREMAADRLDAARIAVVHVPSTRYSCAVCKERMEQGDVIALDDYEHAPEGLHAAHVGCTKEGVERWCRDGRPGDDPLHDERRRRPPWSAAGADRTLGVADGRGSVAVAERTSL